MIGKRIAQVALAATSVAITLAGAEVMARWLEGYPLAQLQIPMSLFTWPPPPPNSLAELATQVGAAPDTDPAWIDDPPPELNNRGPIALDLLALRAALRWPQVPEFDLYNVWNKRYVDGIGCQPPSMVGLLPMPIPVFEPPEPIPHPTYRYVSGRTNPMGLTTNQFGWRGPELPLNKPPNTVRIAFVGASTTVGQYHLPFSYPEYVIHWLNRWAEHNRLPVRFDGINAGRTGIISSDIAAIVRQEVLPMEPDLIVYYEGANQFIFADPLSDAERWAPPLSKGLPPAMWSGFAQPMSRYSLLVRHVDRLVRIVAARGGREPAKPDQTLRWPEGLDTANPDITRADLPLKLPLILEDVESIRAASAAVGTELALSSFVWLAEEGLRLDPIRDLFILHWLNDRCWPYRYADLRRLADFQNLVLRRYAEAHDLLFVGVAETYPRDPNLFFDAIHFKTDGVRVQAWIFFQALLPRVRERIAAGTWPRPDQIKLDHHPNISRPRPYVAPCATDPPAQ